MEPIALFFYFGIPVILLIGGFTSGTIVERRHIRDLTEREAILRSQIVVTNLRKIRHLVPAEKVLYVDGQAVIASDYFKSTVSRIRNFFGGELRSLQTLMSRARREAMARMLENAQKHGATHVYNIRMETSTIGRGQGRAGLITAEVHAYGTAIRVRRSA